MIKLTLFIHLQTKLWGYIGITMSVCLSVCMLVRPSACVRLFTSCLVQNFVPFRRILIIFHTILVNDSMLCHDLDLRSYLQGQGHSVHIPKIQVRAITPDCLVEYGYYFTQLLSMTQRYVITLCPRSKSLCTHTQNMFDVTLNNHSTQLIQLFINVIQCLPGAIQAQVDIQNHPFDIRI